MAKNGQQEPVPAARADMAEVAKELIAEATARVSALKSDAVQPLAPAEPAEPAGPTMEVPTYFGMQKVSAKDVSDIMNRLARLEHADAVRREELENPRAKIIDESFEKWKEEHSRPPAVRTQERVDKLYTGPQRFLCRLDSTREDGKAGPKIDEHFPLVIAANSDLEAQARYLQAMGIRKHDYAVKVEAVAAA